MYSLKDSLQEKIQLLKLKNGDSEAFAFFYDQYMTRVYRFVYMRVSDKAVAQDLTQDIFLKTWQHLVDKKEIQNFAAFIFRVARNAIIDYYRLSRRQELPLEYADETEDPYTDQKTSSIDKEIDLQALLELLKKMKSEYQEVLILRYVEDLSIDDIAQIMQKDKNNIRVLLHRALNKLKSLNNNK
ncbi:MAG: RNA polymerase sigma factor [Prolixibacteraceae bacterium]|nr:RNA polymerase sigma factor [Prolixibacteraceae bacterium]